MGKAGSPLFEIGDLGDSHWPIMCLAREKRALSKMPYGYYRMPEGRGADCYAFDKKWAPKGRIRAITA